MRMSPVNLWYKRYKKKQTRKLLSSTQTTTTTSSGNSHQKTTAEKNINQPQARFQHWNSKNCNRIFCGTKIAIPHKIAGTRQEFFGLQKGNKNICSRRGKFCGVWRHRVKSSKNVPEGGGLERVGTRLIWSVKLKN